VAAGPVGLYVGNQPAKYNRRLGGQFFLFIGFFEFHILPSLI
jgi:hypothetical protein